jgi:hypothetical protein
MPNICENWVRFSASKATIDDIAAKPFVLTAHFPVPAELNNEDRYQWLYESFSTKWVADAEKHQYIENGTDHMLTVYFDSAWIVPHRFYKLLVSRYPDLHIDYEYHCWESGFIGHGQMHSDDLSDPIHCRYDSAEELNNFVGGKVTGWHVCTANPHYE